MTLVLCCCHACRGAGPVGRLKGHAQQLVRLLADPSIAGSQDSHVNAAATAALQPLLVPGVLQQLLAEEQEHESDTQEQQLQPQQQQQLVPALVQLVLQLGAVVACLAAPLQCSDEPASSSQQHAEHMLASLAAAAGYGTTDDLLASCRSQLLEQVRHQYLTRGNDVFWDAVHSSQAKSRQAHCCLERVR